MLRIGPDSVPPDAAVPPDAIGPNGTAATASKRYTIDKLDPHVVVYQTSDMGPFQCSNCAHFLDDGSCNIVSGPIDPAGICHVFTTKGGPESESDQTLPADEGEGADESGKTGQTAYQS